MENDHGAPYYHIHVSKWLLVDYRGCHLLNLLFQRADFHRLLFDLVKPYMTLRLNSKVVSVDPAVPTVTLQSGEIVQGDLIIGADGVKSTIREVVVGAPDKPVPTGDSAYRAIISTAQMLSDPDLKQLVDETEMTGWIGPGRHIMAYCIARVGLRRF
jgi:salicylate hydroxylase